MRCILSRVFRFDIIRPKSLFSVRRVATAADWILRGVVLLVLLLLLL